MPLYGDLADHALALPGRGRLSVVAGVMLVVAGGVLLQLTCFGATVYAPGGSRTSTALLGLRVGPATVRS